MKKTLSIILFASLLSIFFSSCFNPIFYEIRKDVPPEDPTINGPVNSITRYTVGTNEYLVTAANDGIHYKLYNNSSHGAWRTYSGSNIPFSFTKYNYFDETIDGQQIIKVLADDTYLYLVTATYALSEKTGTITPDVFSIWATQIEPESEGDNWKATTSDKWECILKDTNKEYFPIVLDYTSDTGYSYKSQFNVFQTNSPIKSHRKVFFRSGNSASNTIKYFELKGKDTSFINNPMTSVTAVDSTTPEINSAVYFNGEYLFFNSSASTTNENYTDEATHFYYSIGSSVYYNETENLKDTKKALSASTTIADMAFCTDALLLGYAEYDSTSTAYRNGGIAKTSINNGIPGTSLEAFATNAEFQLSSGAFIPVLLNATPNQTELDSCLYATIVYFGPDFSSLGSPENVGLWSYYPGRGNWNRE